VEGQVNLKIPPMSQSGQTLKLKGKGATDPKTRQKGDLYVKLVVKVPKTDDPEVLKTVEKMDGFYKEDLRKDMRL
jgi:DnaJ-class molecular chaperone